MGIDFDGLLNAALLDRLGADAIVTPADGGDPWPARLALTRTPGLQDSGQSVEIASAVTTLFARRAGLGGRVLAQGDQIGLTLADGRAVTVSVAAPPLEDETGWIAVQVYMEEVPGNV